MHDSAAYLIASAFSQAMDHAGLSACSIQWGAWGGVGMVAHNATVLQRMHRAGIEVVKPSSGLRVLAKVLFGSSISPQVCQRYRNVCFQSINGQIAGEVR